MDNIIAYSRDRRMEEKRFEEYFALMEQAFPANERHTAKGHLAEFDAPEFHSLCYVPDGLHGFINYWELDGFVYVEHFAVQPELRGQGIGAELMTELRTRVGNVALVLEAEPPQDSMMAQRRIAFYERLGFKLNPYEYVQPAMAKGESPVPLVIMSSPKMLTEVEFIYMRDTMYRVVYSPVYFF